MMREPDPDLWDSVPGTPEGERICADRERVRGEVEARDKRIATVKTAAALAGWVVHVVDVGPVLSFSRWGRSVDKTLEEAEAFVEAMPKGQP